MSTNHLDLDSRVAIGKKHEAFTLQILRLLEPFELDEWSASDVMDDKKYKIDAFASGPNTNKRFRAQLKYRESGEDLGIALIRPWTGLVEYREDYDSDQLKHDRDIKYPVDLYVCRSSRELLVSWYGPIKDIYEEALRQLYNIGFQQNKLVSADWELKLVTDQGKGHTGGQQKVICYIPFKVLAASGAYLKIKGG